MLLFEILAYQRVPHGFQLALAEDNLNWYPGAAQPLNWRFYTGNELLRHSEGSNPPLLEQFLADSVFLSQARPSSDDRVEEWLSWMDNAVFYPTWRAS